VVENDLAIEMNEEQRRYTRTADEKNEGQKKYNRTANEMSKE